MLVLLVATFWGNLGPLSLLKCIVQKIMVFHKLCCKKFKSLTNDKFINYNVMHNYYLADWE